MNISEFAKPVTAKALNESLAKRFGKKIKLENFSLTQLQDARNKLRTQLSQIEMNESFSAVSSSENYHKNKLFLDVLNAEISERGDIDDEPLEETTLREGAEDQAEIVMAAKDMVDRVTNWMEDTAEMQTESMLELGDKIRDEHGVDQSETFINTVKPALGELFSSLETTRDALTAGVAILTGEGAPQTMGDELPDDDMDMDPVDSDMEADAPVDDMDDEFAAADASAGGDAPEDRSKRETIELSKRLGLLLADSKKKG